MIRVFVRQEFKSSFKYKRLFKKIVRVILTLLSIDGRTEISVVITNDENMKKIYKKYKGINKTTDILSFPSNYKDIKALIGYNMLGDIIFSYQKVENQAIEYGHSLKREWCYLFTHGVLHLLGYDHQTEKEEIEMNKIAYKVMDIIKVGRSR